MSEKWEHGLGQKYGRVTDVTGRVILALAGKEAWCHVKIHTHVSNLLEVTMNLFLEFS